MSKLLILQPENDQICSPDVPVAVGLAVNQSLGGRRNANPSIVPAFPSIAGRSTTS